MKNDKLSIKWTVVLQFFLWLLIYSAAYWILALAIGFGLGAFNDLIMGSYILEDILYIWIERGTMFIVYRIGLAAVIVGYIVRMAVWTEKCYDGLSDLLSPQKRVIRYARPLERYGWKLTEVERSIELKERAAAEAEQRKNDLITYLAHDLKTPLTSIIGYLSLLEESPELPLETRAKYTRITLDKAYRLELLIDEFFDITRFNLQNVVLERNRIDLKLCLEQLAEEFFPAFEEKNLHFRLDCPDGIMLIGDADKLGRVFDNLLKNAVSYSYVGSDVCVLASKTEQTVTLRFRNTGDEIPQAKIDRIFDKFFRLDSARTTRSGGAGLGLAIAKQLVELHGGTLTAHSQKEYTDFIVTLPLT